VSSASLHGLPLSTHQRYELLLTAAQSFFAVSLLVNLRLSMWGATTLLTLFAAQFAASLTLSDGANRTVMLVLSGVYLLAGLILIVAQHRAGRVLLHDGLRADLKKLDEYAPDPA
jgi:cation:H+ antiporter